MTIEIVVAFHAPLTNSQKKSVENFLGQSGHFWGGSHETGRMGWRTNQVYYPGGRFFGLSNWDGWCLSGDFDWMVKVWAAFALVIGADKVYMLADYDNILPGDEPVTMTDFALWAARWRLQGSAPTKLEDRLRKGVN